MSRPLSVHAITALAQLAAGSVPAREFNPGVCNQLLGAGLAEMFEAPTPYPTRKGMIGFLRITAQGHQILPDATAALITRGMR